ncbi:MAG: hypothetical protein IAE78_00100, partial [Myxococcus sp.]|nr:hypothetical protein [Myxococcus sp.]
YSATKVVTWDTTPPTVTLETMARPATLPAGDPTQPTSWVKDEVAYVRLTVMDASRNPLATDVTTMGFNGSPMEAAGNCGACMAPACICVGVDLKDAPLAALRGMVPVRVAAGAFVDVVGNQSLAQMADFNVTRVKWQRAAGAGEYRAAPVLDAKGNLYVGSIDNLPGTAGRVVSLQPADGGVRWTATTGAVQALAAATSATETGGQLDVVYVTSNEDNATVRAGRLRGLSALDGGTAGLHSSICQSGTRPMYSAPALVLVGGSTSTNTQNIGALGLFNTALVVDGNACGYSPSTGNSNATTAASAKYSLPAVPTPAESAVNLVSTGTTHYSVNSDFSVESWAWSMGVPPASTANLPRGGVGPTQTGLTVVETSLLTSQTRDNPREPFGLLGNTLMNVSYSTATSGFTRAGPAVALTGASSGGALVVAGANDGASGVWLRQQQVAAATTAAPMFSGTPMIPAGLPPTNESLPTSPVYGDANQVYLVTRAGRLYVLTATPTGLTYAWDALLPSVAGEVLAHPTLDCNRQRGTTAPGVFYAVSTQGTVTAIVVDSRRLGVAPWPKWQRTAGNAGNSSSDFALNPGCN